jgi:ankyrin repeat protein
MAVRHLEILIIGNADLSILKGKLTSIRDHHGNTFLHHLVALEGLVETLKLLANAGWTLFCSNSFVLELEMDWNARNIEGDTLLHVAAGNNFADYVVFLLQNGAGNDTAECQLTSH